MLADLGLRLTAQDLRLLRRRLDAKVTGRVGFKEVVRMLRPSFKLVGTMAAFVVPCLDPVTFEVDSVLVTVDPVVPVREGAQEQLD